MQSLKLGCIQLLIEVYSDLLIVYFTFVTCVKEELLNIRLMQMNYVQKHSRDHADSERVICGVDHKEAEFISIKQAYKHTNKHSTLYIYTSTD